MALEHTCDNDSREVENCLCERCIEDIRIESFKDGHEDGYKQGLKDGSENK